MSSSASWYGRAPHGHPGRRAVLLGLPRGPVLGGAGAQRSRRGGGGASVPPRLLREPIREAILEKRPTGTCSRRSWRPGIHQLTLEFARRGEDDVRLFKDFDPQFTLGLGVVDVKSHDIETPAVVAERIRAALELVPANGLAVNPDCGLMHLPRDVAFAKLNAMVEGTRLVRAELGG